jgi:branched-chain amino acid transport system ATP-binding protein
MVAVDGVDLSVPEGQLRSIIGPNGAGKTTLFNLITGALRPSAGTISFLGEDVTDLSMDARARKGISRAYQITQVFPNLTVEENLRLAEQAKEQSFNPLARTNPAWDVRAEEMFDRLDIEGDLDDPVSSLSHGEKKKLEVGMSILTEPVILLLDEPTSGLSRDASHHLMAFLGDVAADYTIMLIEHDVDIVLNVSDRITVMHQGRILAEGTPAEISDDEAVQEAYLGGY